MFQVLKSNGIHKSSPASDCFETFAAALAHANANFDVIDMDDKSEGENWAIFFGSPKSTIKNVRNGADVYTIERIG